MELGDWKSDWLYALVLNEAEKLWKSCDKKPDAKYHRYVLIEEWSSAEGSRCTGEVIRAWVRDEHGLHEVSFKQYVEHKSKIHERIYPFISMSFHVHADREHVVIGLQEASTAGGGCRYLVIDEGERANLIEDPSGGFWIS